MTAFTRNELLVLQSALRIAIDDGSIYSGFEDSEEEMAAREKALQRLASKMGRAIAAAKPTR